jgi:hypothetical protein
MKNGPATIPLPRRVRLSHVDSADLFSVVLSEAKDLAVVVTAIMCPVNHQRRHSWNSHRKVLRFAQDDKKGPYVMAPPSNGRLGSVP